jgi:hypothetical protein
MMVGSPHASHWADDMKWQGTVQSLLKGGEVGWGEPLSELNQRLVELVQTGQLQEVSVLRNLTDFGFLGVIEDLYFRSDSGTVYHLLPFNPVQIGFFVRSTDHPATAIPEVERISTKEQNRKFLLWLKRTLETKILGEVTLIETFNTPQFRHLYRVFQTGTGEFIEIIAPDGPLPCRYGRLGEVSPRQQPSKLWTLQELQDPEPR